MALLREDASREVKDDAASGIENASATPRVLTNSRVARFAIMLAVMEEEEEESLSLSIRVQ
jgi:hypothetical protein